MRKHAGEDWPECGGDIVTDSAVGEAAVRTYFGVDFGLISFSPSEWDFSPVEVTWRREAEGVQDTNITLANLWEIATLEVALRDSTPQIRSWEELREASSRRFENLFIAENCFVPLEGVPFAKSAAERFLVLLQILDTMATALDVSGARTSEGHRIIRDYFTGERAVFSDSPDMEKRKFRKSLTFAHPEILDDPLFCTWHGKVPHQTLRLHFSWPITAGKPVYVVYAGPKITKR